MYLFEQVCFDSKFRNETRLERISFVSRMFNAGSRARLNARGVDLNRDFPKQFDESVSGMSFEEMGRECSDLSLHNSLRVTWDIEPTEIRGLIQ